MNPTTDSCRRATSSAALIVAAILMISSLGCASMMSESPPEMPDVPTGPSYKVIFGTAKGKTPEVYEGQVKGNITIQQALKESGAINKYKGMTVDLARRLENGQVLKLAINFDPDTGHVLEEENYAIHPYDEILIRRDDPGMLGSVFKNLRGPGF